MRKTFPQVKLKILKLQIPKNDCLTFFYWIKKKIKWESCKNCTLYAEKPFASDSRIKLKLRPHFKLNCTHFCRASWRIAFSTERGLRGRNLLLSWFWARYFVLQVRQLLLTSRISTLLLYWGRKSRYHSDWSSFRWKVFKQRKKSFKQEIPSAWTQETYRPQRSKCLLCCCVYRWEGGTLIQWVPHPILMGNGYPHLVPVWGVDPCSPNGGTLGYPVRKDKVPIGKDGVPPC